MVGVSWIRGSASTVTENADLCGGLQFCDQLENADRCLASTIARTSRLQKLLTCHISSTTFHQSGRSLSDLNRERSSLMSIRSHVESLLNTLLDVKRLGDPELISKASCIQNLDQHRRELLEAGASALLELPADSAVYDAVAEVIGFVEGSLHSPSSPSSGEPISATQPCGEPMGASARSPKTVSYCQDGVSLATAGYARPSKCKFQDSDRSSGGLQRQPEGENTDPFAVPLAGKARRPVWNRIAHIFMAGGLMLCCHLVPKVLAHTRTSKALYNRSNRALGNREVVSKHELEGEYISQVLEATRVQNVKVLRPQGHT
uniref:Uncharacterized protein n=1 Tax=Ulva partita TaxID=1605170 RepID=A0A1C9ZWB2_9CHLO|nr:hypothetical protein [Ulva partita]